MRKTLLKIITLVIVSIFIYLVRIQLFANSPNSILRILGIIIGVLAVIYFIIEERANLPFFSGRSQSAGSNANAAVVAGLAVALISQSWIQIIIGCIIGMLLIVSIALISKNKTT